MRYSRNLSRYARWHALDFAVERGIGMLLVAIAILGPIVILARRVGPDGQPTSTMTAQDIYSELGGHIAYFLAILVAVGMVAESRRSGTYRFVFSKPVSMPAYYAQQFVLWGLGMVAVDLLIAATITLALGPVSPWGLTSYHVLAYVLLGGLTFFFSTLFRHDWAGVAALVIPTEVLLAYWNPPSHLQEVILALLPPLKALGRLELELIGRTELELIAGNAPALSEVALVAGYGLLFFLVGIVILDRREFAR